MAPNPKESGFSLIELITVVVVLAVLATVGTGFIVSATESYQKTQTRAALVNTARMALERMTRQLRGAMPYSVRVTNSGNCVEFMPVAGGGFYRNPVPDKANNAPDHASIDTAPHSVDFGSADFISIGAMDSGELYGGAPVSLALVSSRSATSVGFPSRDWQRNSIGRRFFLLNAPQGFCLFGGQLRFYPNQDRTAAGIDVTSSYDLLAQGAQPMGAPFTLSSASDSRNVLVRMNIAFAEGDESLDFEQEVLIRNVP
ncbi:PilW family protein [Marinimicrobium agarilyticum]|uniref:PilW family protein n=1 Tax=Marinimicrobium agarilyticum TaxID=306546 RepID=UPI00040996C0|nr:prepilin-type N-terminal cleavage/methylation domain-containing protein [Marinimicrobium agarilyticum]